ncbi:hypothetical protein AC1031_006527 [Aphanomyces cochlioides]|nr:hypothetical protein AC1031_006527 [Aphanomyces cochlioides]
MGGLMVDVIAQWSEDERSKFIHGLQQFGSDWNRIARSIDSKTVQEVYEYASLHYKTMMTGKDLRTLESSMKSGVSILSEQLTAGKQAGCVKEAAAPSEKTTKSDKRGEKSVKIESNENDENTTQDSTTVVSSRHLCRLASAANRPNRPQVTRYDETIKGLSDADIKQLLRKRLLVRQEIRKQTMKRELYEAMRDKLARGEPIEPPQPEKIEEPKEDPQVQESKVKAKFAKKKYLMAGDLKPIEGDKTVKGTTKKRKAGKADFFAGVNALAMVSAEELNKLASPKADPQQTETSEAEPVSLQTPAAQQCSVPWDFAIAPKESKRARKTTAREHKNIVEGKSKRKKDAEAKQPPRTEVSRGDVLELAGFLSSLSKGPHPPEVASSSTKAVESAATDAV